MFQGRNLLIEVYTGSNYEAVGRLVSKSISLASQAIEVTDIDADDWRQLDDRGLGDKSMSISGGGPFFNNESTSEFLQDAVFSGALVNVRATIGSGRVIYGVFKVTSFSTTGEHISAAQFSISLESAGIIHTGSGQSSSFCPTPSPCTPSTPFSAVTGVTSQQANDVIWDGARFIIVGEGGLIWSSEDGQTISQIYNSGNGDNFTGIDYANGLYAISVLGASNGRIVTTTDFTTFNDITITGATWDNSSSVVGVRNIKYFPGVGFFAVGAVFSGVQRYPAIAFSADGVAFDTSYSRIVTDFAGEIYDIEWDGETIIAVGTIDDGAAENSETFRVYSTDGGQNWTFQILSSSIPSFHELRGIDYNCQTGTWIVAGEYSRLFRTTDWSTITELNLGGGAGHFRSLHYSDYYGRWLAGDVNGDIYYSVDDGLTFPNSHNLGSAALVVNGIADDQGMLPNRMYFVACDDETSSLNFCYYTECI